MKKICPCGKKIEIPQYLINRKKFCSKECFYKYRNRPKGLFYNIKKENPTWFKKGQFHPRPKGTIPWNKGKNGLHLSPKSEFKKGHGLKEKNINWKGGITPFTQKIRHLDEYKKWIKNVFERDNYTCRYCGVRGKYLHAHHIIEFKDILLGNNINTIEDAINCKFLWDINNGLTLCKNCHKKITFGVD